MQHLQRVVMEIPMLAPPGDESAIDVLSSLLNHENRFVWINAFHAVGLVGGEKAKKLLEGHALNEHIEKRQIAAEMLYFLLCADIVRQLHDLAIELQRENKSLEELVRTQVFVCYSHKDVKWLEGLRTMLAPLMRDEAIDLWDDTRIVAGQKWRDEIETALRKARVAVLLVSDSFLASDFISRNELPPILQTAQAKGLTVLWVYVGHCLYEETPIESFQAAHRPLRPLEGLSTVKRKEALKSICRVISEAAR